MVCCLCLAIYSSLLCFVSTLPPSLPPCFLFFLLHPSTLMRIRRRPPQIPATASSDPAAGGRSSVGRGAREASAAAGGVAGKGETTRGSGGLHQSMIEEKEKGGRLWGGDSVRWRLGEPGGRSWTGGGSDVSCYGKVVHRPMWQRRKAIKAEDESEEEENDRKPVAAQPAVDAHKAWNHIAAGGVPSSAAAANALAAEAFASAAASRGHDLGSAARKRKNIAWSSSSSWSARSPSSSSSSEKTEIFNGGGITSCVHGAEKKPAQAKNGEEVQQQNQLVIVKRGGNDTGNSRSSPTTTNNNGKTSSKRRRSPAVLMEGSRCSRVNGRGWRCCQQTLVGYSLCEHHLGKGRLRSVTSVRCKTGTGGAAGKQLLNQPVNEIKQLDDQQHRSFVTVDIDVNEKGEAKPAMGARFGRRIGIVKARSISSLLDQTSSNVVDQTGAIQIQATVAPPMVLTATSTGLPAAPLRGAVVSSNVASVATTAPACLSPSTAAPQHEISAVM